MSVCSSVAVNKAHGSSGNVVIPPAGWSSAPGDAEAPKRNPVRTTDNGEGTDYPHVALRPPLPILVTGVRPSYPAAENRIEGTVILENVVQRNGTVRSVKVVKPLTCSR